MLSKRLYWLIPVALLVVGCFKKPEQEGKAIQLSLGVVPYSGGATGSYLIASGPCKGNSAVILTYSSALTPENTVEGKCSNDTVTVNLPIQNGTSNQVFSVNIFGRYQNKKSVGTLVSVNFNPSVSPVQGHTMSIAGGAVSNASHYTWSVVGEVFGGQTQSDPSILSRSGLSGVIDP